MSDTIIICCLGFIIVTVSKHLEFIILFLYSLIKGTSQVRCDSTIRSWALPTGQDQIMRMLLFIDSKYYFIAINSYIEISVSRIMILWMYFYVLLAPREIWE